MAIQRLNATDIDTLGSLVHDYPFKPYRHYRVLARRVQDGVLRAEIEEGLRSPGGMAVRVSGDAQAAVVFHALPWDSAFFGIPMGRILYVLRSENAQRGDLEQAISACVDTCRDAGILHVAARIDVADADAITALEDHGFRLMDALVTYVHLPRHDPPPAVREVGVLRAYRDDDERQIVDIAREAYRGYRSRFHLDPHLPDDRCDELYIEWARKVCTRDMVHEILVSENERGDLHGFTSFRRIEPVSTIAGTPMYGRGLGACRRDRPGAYAGLIRAAAASVHQRGGVAECQTQNYNFSTVRVYEAVGMQYVRADYTFHAWLGPEASGQRAAAPTRSA